MIASRIVARSMLGFIGLVLLLGGIITGTLEIAVAGAAVSVVWIETLIMDCRGRR